MSSPGPLATLAEEETFVEKEDGEKDESFPREETSVEKKNGEKEVILPDKGKKEETPCSEENQEKVE